MKTTLLSCFMMFLCLAMSLAQERGPDPVAAPYQDRSEFLYADDVIILDNPFTDQGKACLAVAYNGWIFTAFFSLSDPYNAITVYRSRDDGATWEMIWLTNMNNTVELNGLDIEVCGDSEASLTVFLAGTHYFPTVTQYFVWLWAIDGDQFSSGSEVFQFSFTDPVRDISIASDFKFPSAGSAPYSVGVAFPTSGKETDVLHFLTSADGGATFPNETSLSTSYYIKNVSVAFGRCNSFPSGRYFLTWDEFHQAQDRLGRIYWSYTEPGFSSSLVPAVRLDVLTPPLEDKCKNPVIASQFTPYDNNVGNLTTVIMFDRAWEGSAIDYDVLGWYNKESVGTNAWEFTSLSNDGFNAFQCDLNFDPAYGNFLATYCDSTQQILPYKVQYLDMPAPIDWALITAQYNDDAGLVAPYPKVEINQVETMTAHVWTRENAEGKGVVMFDAEYNFVGMPEPGGESSLETRVSPNPCSETATIGFYLEKQSMVTLRLYNSEGQLAGQTNDLLTGPGECRVELNVKGLAGGIYLYTVDAGSLRGSGKIGIRN